MPAGFSETKQSRFADWPTERLTESIEAKKQQLQQLQKSDPNWRLWGIGAPGPAERMAAGLRKEIEEMQVEYIGRKADTKPAEAVGSASVTNNFKHADDFRTVCFKGERHELTSRQAQVVQLLFEAHQKKMPEVHKDKILEELGSPASRLRDTFKQSPLWRKLIVSGTRRGTYRLNL